MSLTTVADIGAIPRVKTTMLTVLPENLVPAIVIVSPFLADVWVGVVIYPVTASVYSNVQVPVQVLFSINFPWTTTLTGPVIVGNFGGVIATRVVAVEEMGVSLTWTESPKSNQMVLSK